MTASPIHRLRFGDLEVCPGTRRLLRRGEPLRIGSRAFDLLRVLVENTDRPIPADELRRAVWPGQRIGDNNLHVHFSQLRKLLGPDAVVHHAGRGWRLALAAAPDDRDAADATPSPGPGNLPAYLPPLIGRGDLLAALKPALAPAERITLVGPGGVGKSVLALAAAQASAAGFAHGPWWVELAALREPALLLPAVVTALRLDPKRITSLEALTRALNGQAMLIVLDNCEHLPHAATALCDALLRGAPGVAVLATSQVALRCAGERLWPVPPLELPAEQGLASAQRSGALSLFEARARAADARFALTRENVDASVQVCRRLDGLPLAIQLAAARVPVLGVAGVLQRLDERLRWERAGSAGGAESRHLSLRATLDWSCSLLPTHVQALLRRLGVFAGSFSLEAVQTLAGDEAAGASSVLDALAMLVEHGLVMAERNTLLQATDRPPRYTQHETARLYAREQLGADPQHPAVYAAHARHFLRVAQAERRRYDASGAKSEGGIGVDLDNLRAAIAWASEHDAGLAMALCAATMFYWRWTGRHQEALRHAAPLLAMPAAAGHARERAELLINLSGIDYELEAFDTVLARCDEALLLLQPGSEPVLTSLALSWQGVVYGMRHDLPRAEANFRECCALLREARSEKELGEELNNLGWALQAQGKIDEALQVLEESTALHSRLGLDWGQCVAHENLGELFHGQGRLECALPHWERAIGLARRLAHLYRIAINLQYQALTLRGLGQTARARACLSEALTIAHAQGFERLLADAYTALAAVLLDEGRPSQGLSLLHAAQQLRERRGFRSVRLVEDEHERSLGQALMRLDAFAAQRARAEGERLEVAQALDWAAAEVLSEPELQPALQ